MPVRREHERLQASTRSLWQRENTALRQWSSRPQGRVGTSDATLIARLGGRSCDRQYAGLNRTVRSEDALLQASEHSFWGRESNGPAVVEAAC